MSKINNRISKIVETKNKETIRGNTLIIKGNIPKLEGMKKREEKKLKVSKILKKYHEGKNSRFIVFFHNGIIILKMS